MPGPDLCPKCKGLHFRNAPCIVRKSVVAMDFERDQPKIYVDPTEKPKRTGNRHRPGYFTEYMRKYRADKKAGLR